MDGFEKVEEVASRSAGEWGMVPVVEGFLGLWEGAIAGGGGSRDGAEWVAMQGEAPAEVMQEDEGERRAYWRAFCARNVEPKCVLDFPYGDEGGLNLEKDERLLERLYCFEDHEDDMHLEVGGRRRRVILKVHTLLKWRERGEKLFLRASKVTSAKVIYAFWNAATKCYEQECGWNHLKLVPVSKDLQRTWRSAYCGGRRTDIEWEWRKAGSKPGGEDQSSGEVGEAYDQVRATIAMASRCSPAAQRLLTRR